MARVMREFRIAREEPGDIGVEIEVEGRNLPRARKWWRNEEDGSLKGEESREYVLATPTNLAGVREALNYLDASYKSAGAEVDDTVRAGVHIHINCQRLTMTQLYSFITMYLILENLLVHWCGEFREGNLFCLRACDAEWTLNVLVAAANDRRKMYRNAFHRDELRYASMNLKALGDYGSLEFRAMRGTRDLDLIHQWATVLYGLREYACTFQRPSDIVAELSIGGTEKFVKAALGENFKAFTDACPDWQALVFAGMRNAQDVAYSTNWEEFEPPMKLVGGLEFPANLGPEEINEPMEDF